MNITRRGLKHIVESEFLFRNLLNRRPTREYRQAPPPALTAEAARVLQDLNETGMAISHVRHFAGMEGLFDRLRDEALRAELKRKNVMPGLAEQGRIYSFTANVLGSYPRFAPDSVYALFASKPEILNVINAYFGMFSQLRKYAVFRNLASPGRSVNSSWHRDGDFDALVLRVFAYFNDVDEDNGATIFARGTHHKGAFGSRAEMNAAQLDKLATPCAGRAGTLVFADTRGYHKGGAVRQGERWLFNAMYTSPGYGADYFVRTVRCNPVAGDPVSWALSSPMHLSQNFF